MLVVTKYDRTLALNLAKTKQFPDRATLLDFGRAICQVSRPEQVLERIAEAMTQTLHEARDRIPADLLRSMSGEWDTGRAIAVSD